MSRKRIGVRRGEEQAMQYAKRRKVPAVVWDNRILGTQVLRRRLRLMLRDENDVDDVIQDAYVRMMEISSSGTSIDSPPAFLHRVCVNLAFDRIRRAQRSERLFASSSCDDVSTMLENHPSSEPTPEEHCAREDLSNEMLAVLADLPERCRHVFILRQFWDFNYREIASDTRLSVSMIEKYVKRASVHLHQRFGERRQSMSEA
jgi:RNA polymerase sigma factor (sigma-70 family)